MWSFFLGASVLIWHQVILFMPTGPLEKLAEKICCCCYKKEDKTVDLEQVELKGLQNVLIKDQILNEKKLVNDSPKNLGRNESVMQLENDDKEQKHVEENKIAPIEEPEPHRLIRENSNASNASSAKALWGSSVVKMKNQVCILH